MSKKDKSIFSIITAVVIFGALNASVIWYYNNLLGTLAIGLLIFFVIILGYVMNKESKQRDETLSNLGIGLDKMVKEKLLKFPFPVAVFKAEGIIDWSNELFAETFNNPENISAIIKQADIADMISQNEPKEIRIGSGIYKVSLTRINNGDNVNYYTVYFVDKNDYYGLLNKYNNEKKIVAIIYIDNYQEISETVLSDQSGQILVQADKLIAEWAEITSGLIKKYDRDKYIFVFEQKYLPKFREEKFSILDKIRSINVGNSEMPITLSIGIGAGGDSLHDNFVYAQSAIELALGRGGDHAVIKNGDKLLFYGGKSKEVEKRSKVRARVIAHAINEMIKQSDNVIIMGHKMPDMDCIGAAVGLVSSIKKRNKEVNIVLNKRTPSIELLVERIEKTKEYQEIFINSEQVQNLVTDNTLIIVVDTHRPDSVEAPELLEGQGKIVMIDHHRRGREFIKDAIITYLEPYASATCELVTEIIQYMNEEVKLNAVEAEALLAGIVVDTKNFCFKTGVRTFEAASFLRRQGANSTVVRQLFQNDLNTFLERYNIVKNVQIFNNDIAISTCTYDGSDVNLVVAQAADELLTIQGIKASFVLCKTKDDVMISGRSFGEINVQAILETLGGGGHLTVAGAQVKNMGLDEVKDKLEKSIINVQQE